MVAGEKNHSILICDDDEVLLDFMKRIISSQGFMVFTAPNGEEATDILESQQVDLAVIDLLMPVRSGWEVIEFIRNHNRLNRMPIVAITGLVTTTDEQNKIQSLCDAIFYKGVDFDIENFLELLKKLL